MKKITFIVLILLPALGYAQFEEAEPYASTITKEDLKDYLSILASDALEGRETGTRGQRMAAAFIKSHFIDLGLEAPVKNNGAVSYYQNVPLYTSKLKKAKVMVDNRTYNNYKEIMYYGKYDTDGIKSGEIVYAGLGGDEVIKELDIKDQPVLVFSENRDWRGAVKGVRGAGADLIFVVMGESVEEFSQMVEQYRPYLESGRVSLTKPKVDSENKGVFFVSPQFASEVFGKDRETLKEYNQEAANGDIKKIKKMEPVKFTYMIEAGVEEVKTENVLGYLPGTDLKDEVLVLTAHYDHEGKSGDKIWNGADDDGSGTSAVMEIAEAFDAAAEDGNRPRRSILFMLVTGEEKGLLGSAYYANNPVYPLENTVVNLNIDMIGRVDPKHKDNPHYVYLVGSDRLSSELHDISEAANKITTKFDLDYTYNDEDHPERIYYRSDHWNFAKNDVPVIFYFNGVHEDYHKPTDTVEKINFEVLRDRTRLIFYTAWDIANRDSRPVVDKKKTERAD